LGGEHERQCPAPKRACRWQLDWIEGDVTISLNEAGLNLQKTEHFRTLKDVEKEIDLGNGFKLGATLTLEPPNKVCISGKIKKDFFSFDLPRECVPIG
jgi:hypothetical protein